MGNVNQQLMDEADENSPANFIRKQQEELNQMAQVVPFGMTEDMLPQEFISPSTPDGSLEPTDPDFTGWFGSGIGRTFPINGVDTTICSGVVNSGTLAAGMGQSGGMYAGGGAVTLDEDGVTILANNSFADIRAYSFSDGSTVFGGLYALINGTVRWVRTLAQSLAGASALVLQSISPSGSTSEVNLLAGDNTVDDVAAISVKKSAANLYTVELNSLSHDVDTNINGAGGPVLTVDAGSGNAGIGTTTPGASYKLDVNGVANATTLYQNGAAISTIYAPIAKGVTNGDSHDHNGGDGAQISHANLSNIGTNTHAQIDTHIADTTNPHSTANGEMYIGSSQTINDDAVFSFTPQTQFSNLMIFGRNNATAGAFYGIVAYRVTDNVFVQAMSVGANVSVTTGALTGTTGTDGKLTISAHTDGKIYIENRTGAQRIFEIKVF